MTAIAGTNVGAKIVPYDTDDNFPTHEDIYGKGGYRIAATTAARNAIKSSLLKEGMMVYVAADYTAYILKGGYSTPTIDSDWIPVAGATVSFMWDRVGTILQPHNVGDGIAIKAKSVISAAVKHGVGAGEATSGGTFIGFSTRQFIVDIDSTPGMGFPDTVRWSKDNGSTWEATLVNIPVGALTLMEGVTITFDSQFGHTIGDYWDFTATPFAGDFFKILTPNDLTMFSISGLGVIGATLGSVGADLFTVNVGEVGATVVSSGKQSSGGVSIFSGQMTGADATDDLNIFKAQMLVGANSTGCKAYNGETLLGGLSAGQQSSVYAATLQTNQNDAAGSFAGAYIASIDKRIRLETSNLVGPGFSIGETVTGITSGKTGVVSSFSGSQLWLSSASGAFTVGETVQGGASGSEATVERTQGPGSATTAGFVILGDFTGGTSFYDYAMASLGCDLKLTTVGVVAGTKFNIELKPGAVVAGAGNVDGANINLIVGAPSGLGSDGYVDVLASNGTTSVLRIYTSTSMVSNVKLRFNTGIAPYATAYEIGRNTGTPNNLFANVPTGAGFTWSINGSGLMSFDDTQGLYVSQQGLYYPPSKSSGFVRALYGSTTISGTATGYGGQFICQGAGATSYGVFCAADGATTNYSLYCNGYGYFINLSATNGGVYVQDARTVASSIGVNLYKPGVITGDSTGYRVYISGATGVTKAHYAEVVSNGTHAYIFSSTMSGTAGVAYGQTASLYTTGSYATAFVGEALGVAGENTGVSGTARNATTNIGVRGEASGGTTAWAGYFVGNVYLNGDVTFTGVVKCDTTTIIDTNGCFLPISSADIGAPNNSIYFSTGSSKLVYKDSLGGVHDLY